MIGSLPGSGCSEGIGADDLAARTRAEGLIDRQINGNLDELDRPVAEAKMRAAGVLAAEPPLAEFLVERDVQKPGLVVGSIRPGRAGGQLGDVVGHEGRVDARHLVAKTL